MRERRSRLRTETQRGSAMVEGALTLTVTLMLILGVIEFGRATFAYNQLAYLAQDGARFASLHGSTALVPVTADDISTYLQGNAVGIGSATVTTTWQGNSNVPGNWVRVQVSYPISFIAPYMPSALNLAASAQLPVLR